MTDSLTDGWAVGFDNNPPRPVDTMAVTPPVTPDVTESVTPPVTAAATPPVTGAGAGGVTRPGGEPVTPAGGWPGEPLNVGPWDTAPADDPERDGGLADLLARLRASVRSSPHLGGSSLAAELAGPPDTLRGHWAHVTNHPELPDGVWGSIGFVAGHLIVTFPLKLTGKAMTGAGKALVFTGTAADKSSDRFTSALAFIVIAVAAVAVVVLLGNAALSYLT